MALGTESKKSILRYKDLFIADFWRYLLKAGWLYFPSILFLIIAYGSQTTVNDQRLKNFLHSMYNKPDFFTNIDLYQNAGYIRLSNEYSIQITYSMNWVISDFQRSNMDINLQNNEAFKKLYRNMIQTLH